MFFFNISKQIKLVTLLDAFFFCDIKTWTIKSNKFVLDKKLFFAGGRDGRSDGTKRETMVEFLSGLSASDRAIERSKNRASKRALIHACTVFVLLGEHSSSYAMANSAWNSNLFWVGRGWRNNKQRREFNMRKRRQRSNNN